MTLCALTERAVSFRRLLGTARRPCAPANAEKLLASGMHFTTRTAQIHRELTLHSAVCLGLGAEIGHLLRRDSHCGVERFTRRLAKANRATLVPNFVAWPECLDEHDHMDAIKRTKHAPAEDCPDIIPGPPISTVCGCAALANRHE